MTIDEKYCKIIDYVKEYCGRYESLVLDIFDDIEGSFKRAYCAQRVHHNYRGGLVNHTYEVLMLCINTIKAYDESIKPNYFDNELLISGAVLHDIGKIYTYKEGVGGSGIEKTWKAELEDHLCIGAEIINDYYKQALSTCDKIIFTEKDIYLLKHMILAHHGRMEWGSPVLPRTKEAYVLHQCDMISSKVAVYESKIQEDKTCNMFTEKDNFLGCKVYKGV